MNFELNEEQRMLAESVQRYLTEHYDFEQRRALIATDTAHSDSVWRALAEMGLLGLPFPEEAGGFGGGAVDLMSAMESIGEALLVEPFVANVALAGRLVAKLGSASQRDALLSGLIDGSSKLAFAHLERGARYRTAQVATRAQRAGDGWRLDGDKAVVIGAPIADTLVVSARTAGDAGDADGVSVFAVDRRANGVRLASYRTIDNHRAADIRFDGVALRADALLGDAGAALPAIDEALDFATALLCAEASGAIKSANDATLEYLKTRKQFGVPIGAFQALQHRMVDLFVIQEQVRSMVRLVCSKFDTTTDSAERARYVSAAKILVADACRKVSQEAVQLHGGMGMSEELKVSHTFRRLTMLAQELGDADYHLDRFAKLDPIPGDAAKPMAAGQRSKRATRSETV
ncbi:MAG TPA: acyl-CoA dehydrogenase [Burkholderiaceae bacterium]|nr:acyl-CoA dehydrogenase [Burkholderiaceae bacterium]